MIHNLVTHLTKNWFAANPAGSLELAEPGQETEADLEGKSAPQAQQKLREGAQLCFFTPYEGEGLGLILEPAADLMMLHLLLPPLCKTLTVASVIILGTVSFENQHAKSGSSKAQASRKDMNVAAGAAVLFFVLATMSDYLALACVMGCVLATINKKYPNIIQSFMETLENFGSSMIPKS